ncbi:MAG: metal-sulfur cluster assembly factor [Anaerolineae bacterium]
MGGEVSGGTLRERVLLRLAEVMDPETGVDVVRMRLIEDLTADEATGVVRYKFRPSSPLCPLAVTLALQIRQAASEVAGVARQEPEVVGYVGAEALNALLREQEQVGKAGANDR